ncbi:MFS transporter [Candidatus Latescibacterota bacterium]
MKKQYGLVLLIMIIFFVISFLTNILGPIIPDIIESFNLNLKLVSLLPFAFFIAYGFMSIPSGALVERFGEKPVVTGAFSLAFLGALVFALIPTYIIAILSLFIIGSGMAMLQVALNPLMRVAGGEEHYSFNMVLIQLVFGSASFISPRVYTYMVENLSESSRNNSLKALFSNLVPRGMAWVSLYWIFALVSLIMVVFMLFVKFPPVILRDDEQVGAWRTYLELIKKPVVGLFFLGIFCYVGTEQGIANWISQFLKVYHDIDPHTEGALVVSRFWGYFTLGTLPCMVLLKFIDERRVLLIYGFGAIIFLFLALYGSADVSSTTFSLVGFFLAPLWSLLFSIGLNSIKYYHGAFSGLLCTAIIGGAIVPVIVGCFGDMFGLRVGLLFLFGTLAYIISIGIWANPLVTNKTIRLKKKANI